MVIAVLSLVGVFVAIYLFAHSLGLTGPIVCGVGDCATVQASQYAWVGPIPVSGIGLAGYVALLVLAMVGLQPKGIRSPWVARLLALGAAFGVAFSGYLTYLEAAVINAWCQWCVISAILMTVIFLASLPEWRRLGPAEAEDGQAAAVATAARPEVIES